MFEYEILKCLNCTVLMLVTGIIGFGIGTGRNLGFGRSLIFKFWMFELNCINVEEKTYQKAISNHRCRTQPSCFQLSNRDDVHCNVDNIFHWALFYDRMDKSVVKNFFSEKSKKSYSKWKFFFLFLPPLVLKT